MKNNIFTLIKNKFNKINQYTQKNLSVISILDKLIVCFFFSGIFLLPLMFSFFLESVNVFELQKITFLKIYVIIISFLFIIRELIQTSNIWSNFKIIFKKYYLLASLFIAIFFISILFSSDLSVSFFGKIDRQQGFLSYFLYFVWFILFSLELIRAKFLNKKSNIKIYLLSFILSGFLVSIYAILQYLGIDCYNWTEEAYITKRAFSTLGQPNFLASFLLLVIPLNIYLGIISKETWKKIFLFFSSLLILLAIIFSGSRAAYLSLIFLLCIVIINLFISAKINVRKKVISLLIFIVFIFSSFFVIELSYPGRVKSIVNISEGSSSARLDFYSASFKAILNKPLLGYGVENLQETFVSYYDASWAIHGDVNQVPDRAHNIVLDILMSGGILLLLAYIFLYYDFYRKSRNIISNKKNSYIVKSLNLGVIAYLFSLLFGFAIPSGEFYFFSFLAILTYLNFLNDFETLNLNTVSNKFIKKNIKIFIIFLLCIISSILIYLSLSPLFADYFYVKAIEKYNDGKYGEMTILLDYSKKLPSNKSWKSFYAQKYIRAISNVYPSGELVIDYYLKQELEEAKLLLYNNNFKNVTAKIILEQELDSSVNLNNEIDYLLKVSPSLPQSNMIIALYFSNKGDYIEANNYYNKVLLNLPNVNNEKINYDHLKVLRDNYYRTYLSIAENYLRMNEYQLAIDNYRLAYLNNPSDYLIFKKIADIYYSDKDYDRAIEETKKGERLSPKDYTWALLLHYIYEEINNEELSKLYLHKAQDLGYIEN